MPFATARGVAKSCSMHLAGSGSTLIAAEKTGRCARLIEYDPLYCDTIVRRWESYTGKRATLAGSGDGLEAVAEARLGLQLGTEAA